MRPPRVCYRDMRWPNHVAPSVVASAFGLRASCRACVIKELKVPAHATGFVETWSALHRQPHVCRRQQGTFRQPDPTDTLPPAYSADGAAMSTHGTGPVPVAVPTLEHRHEEKQDHTRH